MNTLISPAVTHSLMWALAVLAVEYTCVLAAILIDLRSGALKAKRNGLPRTSRGYRRTVEKASRYYITLIALTMLDAMWIAVALALRTDSGWALPVFPFASTAGAAGLCLIEIHSVLENSQKRTDITDAAADMADLLADERITDLIKALKDLAKLHG